MKKLDEIRMSLGDQWDGRLYREDALYLLRVADAGRRLTETLAEDEPRPTDHWYYPEWLDLHLTLEEEA